MLQRGDLFQKNKKRQILTPSDLDAFEIQLQLLDEIVKELSSVKGSYLYPLVKDHVSFLVNSIPREWIMTNQRIQDFSVESQRLFYLVYIYILYI